MSMLSAGVRGARTSLVRALGSAATRSSAPAASHACTAACSSVLATASFSNPPATSSLAHAPGAMMLATRGLASKAVTLDHVFTDKPRSLQVPTPVDEPRPKEGFFARMALTLGGYYRCVLARRPSGLFFCVPLQTSQPTRRSSPQAFVHL